MNDTLRRINTTHHLKLSHRTTSVTRETGTSSSSSSSPPPILTRQLITKNFTSLFRVMEFILILAMFTRFSSNFHFALTMLIDFLHTLATTLVSPQFIFVLANGIVLTLLLKRRGSDIQYTSSSSSSPVSNLTRPPPVNQSKASKESMIVAGIFSSSADHISAEDVDVVPSIIENSTAVSSTTNLHHQQMHPSVVSGERFLSRYHRSNSENMHLVKQERVLSGRETRIMGSAENKDRRHQLTMLRRTKTATDQYGLSPRAAPVGYDCEARVVVSRQRDDDADQFPVEHLSGDEFRRTVEDFIARQQKFLIEEEIMRVQAVGYY